MAEQGSCSAHGTCSLAITGSTQLPSDYWHGGGRGHGRGDGLFAAIVAFPTRTRRSLNIKILAPAVSCFLPKSAALPRLVSVRVCLRAVCLSLPLWKRAAGPTVQASDLNKHPERRLESWQVRLRKSELLGKKIGNIAEFQPVALQRAA